MKSSFKKLLSTTIIAVAFFIPSTFSTSFAEKLVTLENNKIMLKNFDQKLAYALGASLGLYMENSLKEQEKLGIKLDKDQLITGMKDAFYNKSQLSDKEIEQTLQKFEIHLKNIAHKKIEKDSKENEEKGKVYREIFKKEEGVKVSSTGLLYKIEKEGVGEAPRDIDTVVVNYKGTLVDGKEFDNSYTRSEPLSFRLDSVIAGWSEGLKNIKKGGKIKLVIPPNLAYGKVCVPGIPASSTLIFDVEMLDIKHSKNEYKKENIPAYRIENLKK